MELVAEEKFSGTDVREALDNALYSFWGTFGVAKAGPLFLKEKFSYPTQRCMFKVNHQYVDQLKMALALNTKIKNTPVILRSIITSGTLKTASSHIDVKRGVTNE